MPAALKSLRQAGVEYAESETNASLSSTTAKDVSTDDGSLCLAGQMAYARDGYKEASTAAGVLEECVLASLNCPRGTDYDAYGTSCVSTERPPAEQATNDAFIVAAGRWADLDVLKNDKAVPACNYQFVPTGTFKLSGMTASIGQLVNVTFRLAPLGSKRAAADACVTSDAAAPLVGVGRYPNCPGTSSKAVSATSTKVGNSKPSAVVLPKLVNLARPACSEGQYSMVVRVPAIFRSEKCFNIGVQLADGTTRRAVVAISARKAAAALP
ncbi:hypothetical protein OEZ86_007305 [Tetradesmus obliquus]|nr:hypothetical protein OEZ86_007305 [Tetradesmus obliquus]